ncbi:hypothetical protein NGM99_09280 [Mesorhizobium sp. RP14(2022)]|uniref:Secreted protein n=1 Tax=Mesorhizobium liriopis TaxID=2953882 RepID=A0ABT1C6Z6_9HYPH|nr:hypothetical protein [Mesorhizobium liriopis]MCO6049985.1 hypothetical protein [Mesorhizobium liriopis]
MVELPGVTALLSVGAVLSVMPPVPLEGFDGCISMLLVEVLSVVGATVPDAPLVPGETGSAAVPEVAGGVDCVVEGVVVLCVVVLSVLSLQAASESMAVAEIAAMTSFFISYLLDLDQVNAIGPSEAS